MHHLLYDTIHKITVLPPLLLQQNKHPFQEQYFSDFGNDSQSSVLYPNHKPLDVHIDYILHHKLHHNTRIPSPLYPLPEIQESISARKYQSLTQNALPTISNRQLSIYNVHFQYHTLLVKTIRHARQFADHDNTNHQFYLSDLCPEQAHLP